MSLSFFFLRLATWPFSLLSYSALHRTGKALGSYAYYLMPRFRKRALSNLALATTLALSEEEIIRYAKESFQNLIITCLEYSKLAKEKEISRVAFCENPEKAAALLQEGKGVIFFCGHQSNWEILFLEGTSRMPGVAIGRPIKNSALYEWIVSIREKFGGKIITPQNAAREGLRALKKGKFLGIVGDQGMPDSGFSSLFLGRRAWTSPLPALLSYRTELPIIVATTKRENGKYAIHYSDPLWPDTSRAAETEIPRLMERALALLEEKIKARPGEWLWQHNRFKQQTPEKLKRPFRQEAIAIFLPDDQEELEKILPHLPFFRTLYPHEFLTLFVPQKFQHLVALDECEMIIYSEKKALFVRDYRFKLIYNFTPWQKLSKHFRSLAAFHTVTLADLKKRANLTELLKTYAR